MIVLLSGMAVAAGVLGLNVRTRRAYLDSLRTLRALAPSLDHVIPGHDPAVLERFPGAEGVADVARLDLPPRTGRAH